MIVVAGGTLNTSLLFGNKGVSAVAEAPPVFAFQKTTWLPTFVSRTVSAPAAMVISAETPVTAPLTVACGLALKLKRLEILGSSVSVKACRANADCLLICFLYLVSLSS